MPPPMPHDYHTLAKQRVEARWAGYSQPEDFGYDFMEWVSLYTKSAHALGGVAIVLQDWASANRLSRGVEQVIREYGRDPELLTNRRPDTLLHRVFNLTVDQVYVPNAFPFVEEGAMSQAVPMSDLLKSLMALTKPELELVRPTMVLSLGKLASEALKRAGVRATGLPHPAAQIGSADAYEDRWRRALDEALGIGLQPG